MFNRIKLLNPHCAESVPKVLIWHNKTFMRNETKEMYQENIYESYLGYNL